MKKLFVYIYIALNISLISGCSNVTETSSVDTKNNVPSVSVQLWSVKNKLKANFKGTLKTLANLGFKGVEFAGNYGPYHNNPEGLKAYLASIGLQASGAHVSINKLKSDDAEKTLLFLKTLGVEFVIIPVDSRAWNKNEIKNLVEDINMLAPKLAKLELQLGYHNHAKEFNLYQNATFWDYIANNTPKNVVLQMDVGWVNYAGKNPIDYLKRYPYRTRTTHIKVRTHKDVNQSPIIGEDDYDWATHIKNTMSIGGTKWLVIEQEEYPEDLDSMQSVAKSKRGLDAILKQL